MTHEDEKNGMLVDIEEMKDVRGATKTESLFVETISPASSKKYKPIYSLRDYDNKGYPSAYNIYMECTDEHEAALRLVGSTAHWRKLCSLKWFMYGRKESQFEGISVWREDMIARDVSMAKAALIERTEDGEVSAARALADMVLKQARESKKVDVQSKKKVVGGSVNKATLDALDKVVDIHNK